MLKQSPEVLDDIGTHGPLLKDIVQHRLKSSTIVCLAAWGPLGCAILCTQPDYANCLSSHNSFPLSQRVGAAFWAKDSYQEQL